MKAGQRGLPIQWLWRTPGRLNCYFCSAHGGHDRPKKRKCVNRCGSADDRVDNSTEGRAQNDCALEENRSPGDGVLEVLRGNQLRKQRASGRSAEGTRDTHEEKHRIDGVGGLVTSQREKQ